MVEHHDIRHEFPEHSERIPLLKSTNERFKMLFDRYHDLDREIRRMEEGIEPVTDDTLEARKTERVVLKDEIYAMLRSA